MRIPRIYLPADLQPDSTIQLDQGAFQHVIKVLRLRPSAELILFNGDGNNYQAVLIDAEKRTATVRINSCEKNPTESPLHIHLGLGISKGERMDYAIQKAVELGVQEISPLFSQRSVVSLDEQRSQKRLEHWQGIIISACEQSGRSSLPLIHAPRNLAAWCAGIETTEKIVLDPLATMSLREIPAPVSSVAALIGPEGGLDDAEISLALENGFRGVNFGPRILRTETAALSVITAIQTLWGDLA